MNGDEPPMPPDFGWRYVFWIGWTNKLSIIMFLQTVFLAITAQPGVLTDTTIHGLLIVTNVLGIALAQYNKVTTPQVPRPVQGQSLATIIKPPKNGETK